MNLQQSKALFLKTILPFSLAGGTVIFLYSIILLLSGNNPLAGSPYGYRDFDLILLIIFASVFLIRYNYKFPGNAPYWEIFFVTFAGSFVAFFFYLILSAFLSYFSPDLLIQLAEENKKFVVEHKNEFVEKFGAKGFVENLNNIKSISTKDLFFSELIKKGIIIMMLSAFIAVAFRFTIVLFIKTNNSKAKK